VAVSDSEVAAASQAANAGDWRRPSPRLLLLRRLEVGVPAAVAAVALVVVVAVAAGLVLLAFTGRRYRSWGYAEREDDLLVRRGIAFTRLSVVPYGRMQFIDVTAGPLERLFDLATVRLHTAAAATDARIPGLEEEEAARLRDRLAELGEAQAAGL
jgi:membrane protein YdbS with pleckstrin-like domain